MTDKSRIRMTPVPSVRPELTLTQEWTRRSVLSVLTIPTVLLLLQSAQLVELDLVHWRRVLMLNLIVSVCSKSRSIFFEFKKNKSCTKISLSYQELRNNLITKVPLLSGVYGTYDEVCGKNIP